MQFVLQFALFSCFAVYSLQAVAMLFKIFSWIKRNRSFTAHISRKRYFLWLGLKKQIQISVDSSDIVPSTDDLQLTTRKVLSVNWDTKTDKFIFDFHKIAANALNLPPTKRNILKICNTIFDPLGVLSPIVLQANLIFKGLCINKYEWDTDIKHDIKMQWNEFLITCWL